jgi:anti-sigma regulatory factor (Ser/Thr protein kinase)
MSRNAFELMGRLTPHDVPDVRRLVENVHRRIVDNGDDVSRLALVTHELLENAVKYSADGTASLRIELFDGRDVVITTRNRARRDDVKELLSIAADIQAISEPQAVYLELMKRAPNARGGLGLGRVVVDGAMKIVIDVDGDVLEVRARMMLTERAA